MSSMARKGVLLVVASPSGAGKSTLSRLLLQEDRAITMSVSATTRPRRPSEVDGVHYHFVSRPRFESMRAGGELLEWAEVHGNLYGTPRAPVDLALAEGRDVLFDVDYQGTLQLYEAMQKETDPAKVRAAMRAFEKHTIDTEVHEIVLPYWYRIVMGRSYVKGWKGSPSHYLNQDLANIWLDK